MATRTFLAGMAVMLLFHVAAAQQCAITASQAASLDYTPIKTGCVSFVAVFAGVVVCVGLGPASGGLNLGWPE